MEKQNGFDFEKMGKRMPYSVPDGFFDQLEDRVMDQIQPRRTSGNNLRILFGAVAAVAVVLFVVHKYLPTSTSDDTGFSNVELAYDNLSTEDQEYLIQDYEDDIFINEEDYIVEL